MIAYSRLPTTAMIFSFLGAFGWCGSAAAHFLELIPSQSIVTGAGGQSVTLDATFTHPMAGGPVMAMAPPKTFGALVNGKRIDLSGDLKSVERQGKAAFTARVALQEPGDHVLFMEPAPYWEPTEGRMIIHYTKVVVDAYEDESGWDALVGFPVEIEPLVRPYGLWTGNLFRGRVLADGKPQPFAEIEVEYRGQGAVTLPSAAFGTQVIRADASGTFAYAMPKAGWWGFAALIDGPQSLTAPDGTERPVEQGALMWIETRDFP